MSIFKKIRIRATIAYKILFGKYRHWLLINLDERNLKSILKEQYDEVEIKITYLGLHQYNVLQILKTASNTKDDIDMALLKGAFHAEAEIYKKNKTSL